MKLVFLFALYIFSHASYFHFFDTYTLLAPKYIIIVLKNNASNIVTVFLRFLTINQSPD